MSLSTEHLPHRRRGSILIAVLAIVFLATVMVYRFIEEAVQELQYRGQVQQNPSLHKVAYSALEVTLGVLHELRTIDGRLIGPAQGWGDPLDYAQWSPPRGYDVSVQILDESGKIGLNTLDKERLRLLFELMGVEFRDIERLADSFLDWQDGDDLPRLSGAESDTYERYDPPYRAANRPIQTWEELRKIEGFNELFFDDHGRPNRFHDMFTSSVSLYHDRRINLHAANPLVLEYIARLEGFDPRPLRDYLDGRDGIRSTADDRLLLDFDSGYYRPPGNGGQNVAAITASMLRVRVWCRRGDAETYLEVYVQTRENDTAPQDQHLPFVVHSQLRNLRIL